MKLQMQVQKSPISERIVVANQPCKIILSSSHIPLGLFHCTISLSSFLMEPLLVPDNKNALLGSP